MKAGFRCVILALAATCGGNVLAQQQQQQQQQQQPRPQTQRQTQTQTQQPQQPAQDMLSRAAASVGIRQCLPAITRLSALNVQGSRAHDVLLDWDRQRPDAGPVFSLVGLEYPNAGAAVSIAALPGPGGTCSVAAERITVAPFTCESVAAQELQGYQRAQLLPIYAVYTDAREPGSSVSLIDSPPGCLVIRRHVEYGWRDPAAAALSRR